MSDAIREPDQPPVGIDLGTTYSVVAYLDSEGRPVTLINSHGEVITPSAVLFEEGEVVVGREAVSVSVLEPGSYADCFKRDVGGDRFQRKVRGYDVPPEILSAFVLERLKKDAEERLGAIRQVVITVPAFFDETRRKATQDAGRLAGLDVLDIINEPTAAALAYGYQHGLLQQQDESSSKRSRVLIYDLGGGTFDVTILEIEGSLFRVQATDGDVRLGGKDFDQRVFNYLAEQFQVAHGVDPRSDPHDAAQLWLDAQEAKHALSERQKSTIVCVHGGVRMRIELTRAKFEEMTQDLLERTETTTSLVVKEAGLDWEQIDDVLLVGGSTRIPMVGEMLQRITGKTPNRSVAPDEAIAHGAALYAGILTSKKDGAASGLARCTLKNVNSHTLGVAGLNPETGERVVAKIIPKNSSLPYRASRMFQTARRDQRSVKVPVVEGEGHRPEDCISLGECIVQDLNRGLPKGTKIQVEFRYAANGRISVAARIPSTRQSAQVEIHRDETRKLEDLETWRKRLLGHVSAEKSPFLPDVQAPVDSTDRASVIRRLDGLYTQIGWSAVEVQLPTALIQSQQSAVQAINDLKEAQATHQQAKLDSRAADNSAEAIRKGSALAQAKADLEAAVTQSNFALLILGRECVNSDVKLPGCDEQMQEIRLLRQNRGR